MMIIMTILFIKRQYGVMQNKKAIRLKKPGNGFADSIMLLPLGANERNPAMQEISLN